MNIRKISKDEDIQAFLELLDGKNLNFLIGAGASMPYLNGLSFGSTGLSFEDIYEYARKKNDQPLYDFLSGYFFWDSLVNGTYDSIQRCETPKGMTVKQSYYKLIQSLSRILSRRTITLPKRVNLFTTNYDMFFEYSFDAFIRENPWAYYNDGSYGFVHKFISTERFHMRVDMLGMDSRFSKELPMFNLIKVHGSLNWRIDPNSNKIMIDNDQFNIESPSYGKDELDEVIHNLTSTNIDDCIKELQKSTLPFLERIPSKEARLLGTTAIVLPTKEKFHETVFQDHYYQSLRILSQELERKQTVLITFGFSFADEHIESIIKRSLLNPELLVLIICYSHDDVETMEKKFSGFENVFLVQNSLPLSNKNGDFKFLNLLLKGSSNV